VAHQAPLCRWCECYNQSNMRTTSRSGSHGRNPQGSLPRNLGWYGRLALAAVGAAIPLAMAGIEAWNNLRNCDGYWYCGFSRASVVVLAVPALLGLAANVTGLLWRPLRWLRYVALVGGAVFIGLGALNLITGIANGIAQPAAGGLLLSLAGVCTAIALRMPASAARAR
jgi:hypothetical protein